MDFGTRLRGRGRGGVAGGRRGSVGRKRVNPGIETDSFTEGEGGASSEDLQLWFDPGQ